MKIFKKSIFIYILISITLFPLCGSESEKLTLQEVIREAINNNYLIKEAVEKEKAALEGIKVAKSEFFPKLYATYSYTRLGVTPEAKFLNQSFPFGPKNNFWWEIGFNQALFMGYALRINKKLANLGVDISQLEREEAMLDVALMAKTAYYQVLLAKKNLKIADEEVKTLKSHVKDAKNFYKEGIIPYNDLLKSQVALAEAKETKVKVKSQLKIAISNLNRVMNRDILSNTDVQDSLKMENENFDISNLFEMALKNRPELKILRKYLEESNLKIKLARSDYYPHIFLMGKYEQKGDNLLGYNNDYQNYHNFYLGISLRWNFFEWGKKKALVGKATHERNSIREKIKGIKDSILLEVKSSFEELKVARENIITAKKALKQAKENFRITNIRYREGITNSTEVLDARAFLTSAEANYYKSLYGYKISKAKLKRALGKM